MSLTVLLWMDLGRNTKELSTGWPLLLSWDLLLFPAIRLPCAEPQDLHTFFAGGGSLCGAAWGWAGLLEENLAGVAGRGEHCSEGNLGQP
jgi:hypothetical protein